MGPGPPGVTSSRSTGQGTPVSMGVPAPGVSSTRNTGSQGPPTIRSTPHLLCKRPARRRSRTPAKVTAHKTKSLSSQSPRFTRRGSQKTDSMGGGGAALEGNKATRKRTESAPEAMAGGQRGRLHTSHAGLRISHIGADVWGTLGPRRGRAIAGHTQVGDPGGSGVGRGPASWAA